ncbi:MAG TPA: hypothetical protein VFE24_02000 [Pirellulales bacterium]|nr:hypothetical protein [Pirellulales bacterium]
MRTLFPWAANGAQGTATHAGAKKTPLANIQAAALRYNGSRALATKPEIVSPFFGVARRFYKGTTAIKRTPALMAACGFMELLFCAAESAQAQFYGPAPFLPGPAPVTAYYPVAPAPAYFPAPAVSYYQPPVVAYYPAPVAAPVVSYYPRPLVAPMYAPATVVVRPAYVPLQPVRNIARARRW